MTRTIILILSLLSSAVSPSQNLTFPQTVSKLFFGVDISSKSASLLDSFLSVSQLHHQDTVAKQWNLNASIHNKTNKGAWSSKHEFSFAESPLPDLKIAKGLIEVTVAETDKTKTLLGINWHVEFNNKAEATNYFEKLKQIFTAVSDKKKVDFDKEIGHIAQFSTRKPSNTGVRDITLFLSQSSQTKKYQIALLFGNELMGE